MDLCLLCTRLKSSYGQHARGGSSTVKNKRFLDIPSFAVTRRLLAAARLWIMIRAPLADHQITIDPKYVEGLRHQFMRMFIDFVADERSQAEDPSPHRRFPSCPSAFWLNTKVRSCGEDQVPAIIFPGGPNFHAFAGPLERAKPVVHSDSD